MKPTWTGDGVELWCGDCLAVLPELAESFDLVTDPPYGIGEAAGKNKSRSLLAVSRDYGDSAWDNQTHPEGVSLSVSKAVNAIVFGGNYYDLPPTSCWLVWDKINGKTDFADCELAWTNLTTAVRLIRHQWHGFIRRGKEEREHPTQKPVRVMQWCIQRLPESDRPICDAYCGSGTTGVAAIRENRRFIGIEKDPAYFEIARERIERELREQRIQPKLF